MRSQSAVASILSNSHATDERELPLSRKGGGAVREQPGSSPVLPPYGTCVAERGADRTESYGKDGPMHAALSFLGAAMLILVGVVVVLATVILILYEACWIVRLGQQLSRAAAAAEPGGRGGEDGSEEGGRV